MARAPETWLFIALLMLSGLIENTDNVKCRSRKNEDFSDVKIFQIQKEFLEKTAKEAKIGCSTAKLPATG